ncbi:MAG: transporter substrate-binding domain-containing protein [Hyphomicrobiaceae bacterium]|nr:transporter substrate-binding domain-containing protein [Hyphomicrobiaceae bacterium]
MSCVFATRRAVQRALHLAIAVALQAFLCAFGAAAQTCGTEYTIKEGETLAQIAARAYGNPGQWTVIFYANQDRLGPNDSLLVPGLSLRVPCIGGVQQSTPLPPIATTPAPTTAPTESAFIISALLRRVDFLTADGLPPYTGRALESGGMLTNVITSAMGLIKEEAKGKFEFGVSWVNDWSAHLNPLLLTRAFDVGFPWSRPDCDNAASLDQAAVFRCQRFFFSDPLYEVGTNLFVRTGSNIRQGRTEEVTNTSLCRAAGRSVHELDQGGKNWLKDRKVTLIRPPTVEECFRLLETGTVEGVVETELVGRSTMTSLGLADKVRMIDQPMALTTYHVLISKTHPHARTILYYINTSLGKLRDSGEYDKILVRHLGKFWDSQVSPPNPAVGAIPASAPKATGSTPPAPAKGKN